MQLLDGLLVVTKILLAADKDDGKAVAEVQDFRDPLQTLHVSATPYLGVCGLGNRQQEDGAAYLLLDVVKRIWGVNGETDQDDVRVGIRERAKTVVILLTSGIPQGQLDVLAINLDIGDVVLEDGGDVDLHSKLG